MAFPSNAVERLIRDVMEQRASMDDLLRALADAPLIVPTTGLVGAEQDRAEFEVVAHEGRPYVPAFTSADQHAYWRGGAGRYVLLTGRQLGATWPDDVGLAVNPNGDAGLPLAPATVQALAGPVRTVPAETTVRVGLPAKEPEALLHAVAAALRRAPMVVSARRALVAPEGRSPSLVLALELDTAGGPVGAAAEHAAVSAAREGVEAAGTDLPVDVLCFASGEAGGLARTIAGLIEPFYQRGVTTAATP